MALSLAACGGSSSTTTTPVVETPVVDTPVVVTPASESFTLTSAANAFTGGDGADSFTAATAAVIQSFDTLDGGAGTDTLTITDVADAYEGATGVGGTITNVENLTINSSGGFGTAAAAGTAAGTDTAAVQQVASYVVGGTFATNDVIDITVNGVTYSATVGNTGSTSTAGRAEAITAINAVLNDVVGDTVTLGSTSSGSGTSASSAVSVTSNYAGTGFTLGAAIKTSTAGTISMAAATAAQTATAGATSVVANVVSTGATAAKQVLQIAIADSGGGAAAYVKGYEVTINGTTYTGNAAAGSVDATGTTPTAIAADLVTIINSAFGSTVAAASSGVITLTAPVAGTPLPLMDIDFVADGSNTKVDPTVTYTQTVANKAANSDAVAAVTEAVFDASGFSGEVKLTAADDVIIKAAATADVTITSSAGSVDVDGGATVNVTGTGAVDIMGDKITSATVKTGTGTGDTVNIGATSGTTADTPLLETASVTGGTTITISDNKNSTSAKTLTTVDLSGIGGTATLTGDAIATVNWSGQKTAQTVNVVNGSTTVTELALNLDGVGYDADGASATSKIITDAKTLTIASNGSKSDIDVEGSGTATATVNVTGAADLALELDSSTTIVKTLAAGTMTGDLTIVGLEANAISVSTGAGDDTFTTVATAALTVSSGAGSDTVTLNSATAKGSTIDLGAGDDDLLIGGSGSVAVDDAASVTNAKITIIDGGDGTDMVAATFVTNGNADQFVNFEVLGLNGATLDTSLISTSTLELISTGGTYTNLKTSESLAVAANAGTSATTLTFATAEVAGTSDDYSISFVGKGATTSTAASPTNIDAGTVVIQGIEDVTISSGQTSGFVDNEIDLTGANIQTVTITGAADTTSLAFAGTNGTNASGGGGAVNLIDASAVTGDTSINTTNVTADNATGVGLTVKGGSGIDAIVMAQGGTVYGNAGADVITTANAATTIYGGAGNDEFIVTSTIGSTYVKIMDLAVGDKIDFGTATAFGTAAVDVSSQTTLAGAIGAADGTDDKVSYFDFGGDTYIVLAGSSTGAITDDTVIQLVGDYDLSTATLSSNELTIA